MRFFTKPSRWAILGLLCVLASARVTPCQAGFVVTGTAFTTNGFHSGNGSDDFGWHYSTPISGYDTIYTQNQNVSFVGVAEDSSGNVYVTTNFGERDLLKFSPSNTSLQTVDLNGTGDNITANANTSPTTLATGLGSTGAVVLGPDGDLYAVSGDQIVKYNTTTPNQTGTVVAQVGGLFTNFVGLAFNSSGTLYASVSNGSIVSVDSLDGSTTSTTTFSNGGSLNGSIGGLVFLNGTLYAADGDQIYAVTDTSQTGVLSSPESTQSFVGLAVQPGDSNDLFAAGSGAFVPNSNIAGVIFDISLSSHADTVFLGAGSNYGGTAGNGNPENAQFLAFDPASPADATPEPASLTLFGIGVCALMGYRWKRRDANPPIP